MVCINCAGLPAELIESELFGSSRGSFTGSLDRTGIFKHANFSTVFLDELSEMPLHLQSKLLRFIQDKRVRRVGGVGDELVDVRVVAAVNQNPLTCIKEKRLREDLYYRLSTITVMVPPLRDRSADILPLAISYLDFFSERYKRKVPALEPETIELLRNYDWPGNVRQLINEMNRCALLCNGKVGVNDLSVFYADDDVQKWVTADLDSLSPVDRSEVTVIVAALRANQFNKRVTCVKLGMGRSTLHAKIARWGIKTPATDERVAEQTLLHTATPDPSDAPAPSPRAASPSPRKSERSSAPPAGASGEPAGGGLLD